MKYNKTGFQRKRPYILFIFLLLILSVAKFYSQTISVSGRVTASRFPVSNAQVTFVNSSDTSNKFSTFTDASGNYQIHIITSLESISENLPTNFKLEQSYPNPFYSSTAIPYQLKQESDVQITIYDILGREVRNYNVGIQNIGLHNILWDGRNGLGQKVASGIYFYRLQAGGESQVKKMILSQSARSIVSIPRSYNIQEPIISNLNKQSIINGNYNIRIENTSSTTPIIAPKEEKNILIQRDTSITFSVNYISVTDIDLNITRQLIQGFGAANIVGWRPDMTTDEIEKAFGTGDGKLGFTILRLRISPNPNDWGNNVSTAKAAYQRGAKIIASPWSPPASMKTNNNLVGGELREDSYANFAAHLKAFKDFMANNGVPIYAISVQNEPDISVNYESCDYTPAQMVKFMRENAPDIGTKVMAPESFQFRRNMSDPILNDSLACANLDIVAGHIYGGGLAAYPLAEQKGKEVWMTEHLTGENSNSNVWSWAFQVASEMNSVMKAGMNAYIWWYLVRFYGPISDGTNDSGIKGDVTKKGYVMSQFARFIRPGYYRIETADSPPLSGAGISTSAYKDPVTSKLVIVAINTSTSARENVFRLQNGNLSTSFTPYTTSINKNCEQGENLIMVNGRFSFTLEPSSITTFISN